MNNNDVLRRLRYIFDLSDARMGKIFSLGGLEVRRGHIVAWTLKDEDPAFEECNDRMLAAFLNGLIIEKRGKREGPQPKPEQKLGNNLILMKLKIALALQAEDVIEVMDLAGFSLSASELSAFTRRPGHRNYRKCQDQVLRNFLMGLQIKLRGETQKPEPVPSPWGKPNQ